MEDMAMGTIRLNCNWDYDKLLNIVNEHRTKSLMLGYGMRDENYRYPLQTLKDDVSLLAETEESLKQIPDSDVISAIRILEIMKYMLDVYCQIDQITRRVMDDEKVPHCEKVFSVFEEHSKWISKGKAGVPQELGLNVCIVEDQYGSILHHKVIEKQSDKDVAVIMIADTKKRFKDLGSCSFDKGFYSSRNLNKIN